MSLSKTLKSLLFGIAALAATGPALADQLADVKAAGKIVTATDMHYAPFDVLNNGTYEGMTKDLFDGVAKELGVEPVYQDIPWTAELPGLEVKKFDIVIAPVTITPERLERYAFTLPIADATVSLVKAASNTELTKPEDIKGKTGAVQAAHRLWRKAGWRHRQGIRHHGRGLCGPRRRPSRCRRRLAAEPHLSREESSGKLCPVYAVAIRRADLFCLGTAQGRR